MTYVPGPGAGSADAFAFRANDGELDSQDAATVTLNITPVVDLGVVFTANGPNPVLAGELTYGFRVTNQGPSDATSVVVSLTLLNAAGVVDFVSATPNVFTQNISGGDVVFQTTLTALRRGGTLRSRSRFSRRWGRSGR